MPAARDVYAFPLESVSMNERRFTSIVPISTGGLPSTTGAVGVPSGVTQPYRLANTIGITRAGAGLYTLTFAPAPAGTVKVWMDLQGTATPTVLDFSVVTKDVQSGYCQIQCYNASGAKVDPAVGDVLGIEYTAFTTGSAAGP